MTLKIVAHSFARTVVPICVKLKWRTVFVLLVITVAKVELASLLGSLILNIGGVFFGRWTTFESDNPLFHTFLREIRRSCVMALVASSGSPHNRSPQLSRFASAERMFELTTQSVAQRPTGLGSSTNFTEGM